SSGQSDRSQRTSRPTLSSRNLARKRNRQQRTKRSRRRRHLAMNALVLACFVLSPPNFIIGNPDGPKITARSALIMEAKTGRIIWGRNVDIPRYPASTTKIMTGLLLAENTKPTDL